MITKYDLWDDGPQLSGTWHIIADGGCPLCTVAFNSIQGHW